jgi:hypothetical protein
MPGAVYRWCHNIASRMTPQYKSFSSFVAYIGRNFSVFPLLLRAAHVCVRMDVNGYFSVFFPGDSLRNVVPVWKPYQNPRGALEGIFIDLHVMKCLLTFPKRLLLAVWQKIGLREGGLLWNPSRAQHFLDIQHNLHGAWLADAANVRGGWVTARVYLHVLKFFSIRPFSPPPPAIYLNIFNCV